MVRRTYSTSSPITTTTVEKLIVAASQTSYGEGLYTCPEHDGTQHPGPRPDNQLKNAQWEHKCPLCGEDMPPAPIPENTERICHTIYAQTKTHQEDMVLNIGRAYKIPHSCPALFQHLRTPAIALQPLYGCNCHLYEPPQKRQTVQSSTKTANNRGTSSLSTT